MSTKGDAPGRGATVVECSSPAAFAASLLDAAQLEERHDRVAVPVLGAWRHLGLAAAVTYAPTRSHDGLREAPASALLERLVALAEQRSHDLADDAPSCLVFDEDPLALAGAAHALLAGKRLRVVRSGGDLAAPVVTERSVTVVLSPLGIARYGVETLRADLFARRDRRVPWGLLTASTLSSLSHLVARTRLRAPAPAVRGRLFTVLDNPRVSLEGLAEWSIPDRPYEGFAETAEDPTPLLMLEGHGRPYCAIGGNLCSRTERAEAGDTRCVRGFDCVHSAYGRVPASRIVADVVFVNSCSTANFGGLGPETDDGLTVATHLLDGHACALVAANRTLTPADQTPYVLWQLLTAGEPLGEATRLVGEYVSSRTKHLEPYVLLGDPELRVFGSTWSGVVPTSAERDVNGRVRVVVEPVPGRVVRHRISGDAALAEAAGTPGARVHALASTSLGSGTALFEVVRHGPSDVDVLACWSTDAGTAPITLLLEPEAPFRDGALDATRELLENLRTNASWLDDAGLRVKRELEELTAQLGVPLEKIASRTLQRVAEHDGLRQGEDLVVRHCELLNRSLTERLRDASTGQVLWIYTHYQAATGFHFDGETADSNPCPYCSGRLHVLRYRVDLLSVRYRYARDCERCGVIGDTEDGSAPPRLLVPRRIRKGQPFPLELQGNLEGRAAASVNAFATFSRQGNPVASFAVTPEAQETRVARGASFRFAFEGTIADSVGSNVYNAQGIVVANGAIGWALRKVFIDA